MSDHSLVGLFLTRRDVYDKYESTVPTHLIEPEAQVLIEDIGKWYAENPSETEIVPKNITEFWDFMKFIQHSNMSSDKLTAIKELVKRGIQASSGASAANVLKSLVLRDHAGKIAEKCDRFSAGDTSFPLFQELMDDAEEAEKDAGIHVSHSQELVLDLNTMMDAVTNLKGGLHWKSPAAEAALGPIRKGNFIMIAGFVDSGKSTFMTQEAVFMASQLPAGKKVLVFSNEEDSHRVGTRVIQCALEWSLTDMDRDRNLTNLNYDRYMGGDHDKVVVVHADNQPITPGLIRKKLREYDVGLVVFDQLYKVKGFKRYGDDKLGQLQDIFEYGRQLAKSHCPVIAVHQARGDANGCQKIEMHQLAGSQQAMQGELDAIITIGRDLQFPAMRYLYFPKNKMPTPGDPSLRNGFFEVEPDFEKGVFDK